MAKRRAKEASSKPLDLRSIHRRSEGQAALALRSAIHDLQAGRVPTPEDVAAISEALRQYDAFEVGSIGEALGFPWNKHLEARRRELSAESIAWLVYEIQESGRDSGGKKIPLLDSGSVQGALSRAADQLGIKESTVKKYRDAWLKYCKDMGLSPPGKQVETVSPEYLLSVFGVALSPSGDFSKGKISPTKRRIK